LPESGESGADLSGSYAQLLWTTLCATEGIVIKHLILKDKFPVPVNEAGGRRRIGSTDPIKKSAAGSGFDCRITFVAPPIRLFPLFTEAF
jgi:hypothetical protein